MKTKVVISISGGNLESVESDGDIEVEVFDWDNINDRSEEEDEDFADREHVRYVTMIKNMKKVQ